MHADDALEPHAAQQKTQRSRIHLASSYACVPVQGTHHSIMGLTEHFLGVLAARERRGRTQGLVAHDGLVM